MGGGRAPRGDSVPDKPAREGERDTPPALAAESEGEREPVASVPSTELAPLPPTPTTVAPPALLTVEPITRVPCELSMKHTLHTRTGTVHADCATPGM
jgi:hypothetical protein